MMRFAFAAYLMLAVAIAPSMCCCTASSLLQVVVARIAPGPAALALAGHCHQHVADHHGQSRPAGRSGPDHCPCREGTPSLVLATLKSNIEVARTAQALAPLLTLDQPLMAAGDLHSQPPRWIRAASPVKDSGEILRAYQHFRC